MPFTPKFADLVRNVATVTGTGPVTAGRRGQRVRQPDRRGHQRRAILLLHPGPRQAAGARGRARDDAGRRQGGAAGDRRGSHQFHQRRQDDRAGGAGGVVRTDRAARGWSDGDRSAGRILRRKHRGGPIWPKESGPAASSSTRPTIRPRSGPTRPRPLCASPPSSDPSGASGAWVRRFDGPVNCSMVWSQRRRPTNDGPAFAAALAPLKAIAVNQVAGWYRDRQAVHPGRATISSARRRSTSPIRFILEGEGSGQPRGIGQAALGGGGDRYQGAAVQHRWRQRYERARLNAGDGSIIRGLHLQRRLCRNGRRGPRHPPACPGTDRRLLHDRLPGRRHPLQRGGRRLAGGQRQQYRHQPGQDRALPQGAVLRRRRQQCQPDHDARRLPQPDPGRR